MSSRDTFKVNNNKFAIIDTSTELCWMLPPPSGAVMLGVFAIDGVLLDVFSVGVLDIVHCLELHVVGKIM